MEIIMLKFNKITKALLFALAISATNSVFAEVNGKVKEKIEAMFDKMGNDGNVTFEKKKTKNMLKLINSISKLNIETKVLKKNDGKFVLDDSGDTNMSSIKKQIYNLGAEEKKLVLPIFQLKVAYARIIKELDGDAFKELLATALIADKYKKDNHALKVEYFMDKVLELECLKGEYILGDIKALVKTVLTVITAKVNALVKDLNTNVFKVIDAADDDSIKADLYIAKCYYYNDGWVNLAGLIDAIKNMFKKELMNSFYALVAKTKKLLEASEGKGVSFVEQLNTNTATKITDIVKKKAESMGQDLLHEYDDQDDATRLTGITFYRD